jgi:hypothetical protein
MDAILMAPAADQRDGQVAEPSIGGRWTGAAVAASVAFIAALVGLGVGAPFLLIGIPAATIAGWRLGPKVRPAGGVAGMTVAMAVVTIASADALFVIAAVASTDTGLLNGIVPAMLWWAAGFVVVGIPMMTVVVPCALVWAVVVQRLARGNRHVAPGPERGTA